jgi:hypothetical protein
MAKKKEEFKLDGYDELSPGVFQKRKTTPQPREIMKEGFPDWVNNLPILNGDLVFKWADIHVSLNDWYSSEHWTKRNKTKNFWHKFFADYLPTPKPFFPKYEITLEFNSRLDASNTITMVKLCEDTLKKEGVITDDSIKYCKGIHLIPIEDMKRFSYKLTVKEIK